MLELLKFDVILIDFSISLHDFGNADAFIIDIWKVSLELCLELVDLDSESIQFLFDLNSLITDNIDDVFLDLIDLLLGLVETSLSSFDGLNRLVFSFFSDLNAVLLELDDHVSHPLHHNRNATLDILHLTDMLHDLHEKPSVLFLLPFIGRIGICEHVLGVGLQASICPEIELLEVLEGCLVFNCQEVSVNLDPVIDLNLKRLDEVSKVDFDPCLFDWSLNL